MKNHFKKKSLRTGQLTERNVVKGIVVDSGYKIPAIARQILEDGKIPIMLYKRPMTRDGFFKKYEYAYDEY
jgi:hypothetical protein